MWFRLFIWRIRFMGWKSDQIHKYFRRRYCHKGFHKLKKGSTGWGGTGQRMKWVHFLKCYHCNYIFFAKKSDKERYLKLTAKERSAWPELLSSTKSKQRNSIGRSDGQEASASE